MEPKLIGYFPKQTMKRPDWLKSAKVKEICSVSDHMSSGPEYWIDLWKHNDMWFYDSESLAWSIIPKSKRSQFDLYAYRLFPCRFVDGQQEGFEIPALQIVPLPRDFKSLGYDAVSRSQDAMFECSPLSCNYMANEIVTNEFCLLNELDNAFAVANDFSVSKPEPGPYCVVEVFRKM